MKRLGMFRPKKMELNQPNSGCIYIYIHNLWIKNQTWWLFSAGLKACDIFETFKFRSLKTWRPLSGQGQPNIIVPVVGSFILLNAECATLLGKEWDAQLARKEVRTGSGIAGGMCATFQDIQMDNNGQAMFCCWPYQMVVCDNNTFKLVDGLFIFFGIWRQTIFAKRKQDRSGEKWLAQSPRFLSGWRFCKFLWNLRQKKQRVVQISTDQND